MRQRKRQRRGRRVRLVPAIGVGEEQPVPTRNVSPLIARPRLSDPFVGKLLAGDDLQARIALRDCVDDAARGVRRAIVDDDHLKIGITC